jgi:hypothetical protein
MSVFPSLRIEGGLLGPDVPEQLLAGDLPGQKPADFGLEPRRNLTNEIAAAFADARALWAVFQRRLQRLPEGDLGTSITRDAWVVPFLGLLGYELRYNPRAYDVDGLSFAISYRAGEAEGAPPVHIVGARQELGRLAPTGRPRLAPHSLVQEFLNRTEHLWGLATNGLTLRLLRNSTFVRRQAYVEFDLAPMLEEERFQDFALLYRLLHRSRLPRGVADASTCLLEQYYQHSLEQGGRVRDHLRDGVEECLLRLGNGFLSHSANEELRHRASPTCTGGDRIPPEEFYRQLLRIVYRFLFLLVSEDRGLISPDPLYREHYGIARLRRFVDRREAYTEDDDLWHSLRVLWKVLTDEKLAAFLQVAPLNGELFAPVALDQYTIGNRDLLEAFWHLAYYLETPSSPPRRVNYAALDVEELGSVYESLLELRPAIEDNGQGLPRFLFGTGSERRTTGSYYTAPELVADLIRSALDPVMGERLEEARRMANSEWRMVQESYRKEFISYANQKLSRSGSLATWPIHSQVGLPADEGLSERGTLRHDGADPSGRDLDSIQHRRGMGQALSDGIHSVSTNSEWKPDRVGDASDRQCGRGPLPGISHPAPAAGDRGARQTIPGAGAQPPTEAEIERRWNRTPFATRHSLFAEHVLLALKVCDPACGSGHFLLAAARRLGKELARIRTGEDEPAPERVREAVRDIVAHCIYGVDKNPLAVELCRVALWLESHAEGKPLTFLDHRIRCGDSLVGLPDPSVLKDGIPDKAFEPVAGDDRQVAKSLKRRNGAERQGQYALRFDAQAELRQAAEAFRPLLDTPDDTPGQIRTKQRAFQDWEARIARDRMACDLWTAAFFQPLRGHNPPPITTDILRRHLESQTAHPQAVGAAHALAHERRFFHWFLGFPDVFTRGGFDVVLGNPPFLGGLKLSGAFGDKYRHFLTSRYDPFGGTADLCAAFYRRAFSLLKPDGFLGMVATNTIGQGDTRESGLAVILKQGGAITFARRFVKWPGQANVEVNLIAIHKPDHSPFAIPHSPILDGQPVPFISSRLDPEPEAEPQRLRQNEGKSFQGDIVRGIGFVLEPEEAEALLAKDPRNADCLFPYLNGEDLNSHPEQKPSRWVICFHDWDLERAKQYPDLLKIVGERVKPERERLRGPGDKRNRACWWQFGAYRAGMRRAIAPLRRVLVRSRVSELHALAFLPQGWVYNEQTIVFAFDDDYHFAILEANIHEAWVRRNASTMRTDIRYTPTDCFDTFPFPQHSPAEAKVRAERLGADYHEHRRQIMLARNLGLTKTYNLFHDPECRDADIVRLRELHTEMDRTILACYGWDDLDPQHDFYPNDRGQTRFTITLASRREILRRLLDLNLQIGSGEKKKGEVPGKGPFGR